MVGRSVRWRPFRYTEKVPRMLSLWIPSLYSPYVQRILALTGPAGTAKTTTIRVLAHEMGFEIIEWRNAMGESSTFGTCSQTSL